MAAPASSISRQAFEAQVLEQGWLGRHQNVLIGVSGGADSVVLTHLITPILRSHGVEATLIHVHHGLRGQDADTDAAFVAELANELGWRSHIERVDTRARIEQRKESMEMAARADRRRVFQDAARRFRSTALLTGHNADDQIELFFIRLLRGAGIEGLAGMRAVDATTYAQGPVVVRPLLAYPRATIRHWANAEGRPFREDASNRSTDPLRNRIRLELIPVLERLAPDGFRNPMRRCMATFAQHAAWVDTEIAQHLPAGSDDAWDALPIPVKREALARGIRALGVDPNESRIDALLAHPNSPISTSPDTRLIRDSKGTVRALPAHDPATPSFDPTTVPIDLEASLRASIGEDGILEWAFNTAVTRAPDSLGSECFDADTIGPTVTLRHWRSGDRFQPIGMNGSLTLQDWFVNQKIPKESRRRLWLAEDSSGRIFWIEGQRISEIHKRTGTTSRGLLWRFTRNEKGPTETG